MKIIFIEEKNDCKRREEFYACFVVCFVHVFAFSTLQLILNEKHNCLHYFN